MKLKPTKIVCVGLNYRDHAAELKMKLPAQPLIFLKPPSALIYHEDNIVYPPMTKELSYEAELAIVIKDRCKNITAEEAAKHILGYTCANDVTARDIQKSDGQWTRAKGFDTFCPVGPKIVSGTLPGNLAIKLLLNGKVMQSSNTSNMIFSADYLISFISKVMTLEKEDIILTGTPPGVGSMKAGDVVEVEIESIGKLTNKVITG